MASDVRACKQQHNASDFKIKSDKGRSVNGSKLNGVSGGASPQKAECGKGGV